MSRTLGFLGAYVLFFCSPVLAQVGESSDELKRFTGSWRIAELVDNGQTLGQESIKTWLPSGGDIEIIDNTMLFKSRLDGQKEAKVFSIDASVYPKVISVATREKAVGWGIYRFENERIVICMSDPSASPRPTDFSAKAGSNRMLMVLEPADPAAGNMTALRPAASPPVLPRLPAPAPATPAPAIRAPATPPPAQPVPAQPAPAQPTPAQPAASPPSTNVTVNLELPNAPKAGAPAANLPPGQPAAKVLTDPEIRQMLVGGWRLQDGVGTLQVNMNANGQYQTYREVAQASTFHAVFVPTPVSSGTWSVQKGQLILFVAASTLPSRINQSYANPIRSVSATDLIFIDYMGRVVRATRVQ